jgi:hypothetical protein
MEVGRCPIERRVEGEIVYCVGLWRRNTRGEFYSISSPTTFLLWKSAIAQSEEYLCVVQIPARQQFIELVKE